MLVWLPLTVAGYLLVNAICGSSAYNAILLGKIVISQERRALLWRLWNWCFLHLRNYLVSSSILMIVVYHFDGVLFYAVPFANRTVVSPKPPHTQKQIQELKRQGTQKFWLILLDPHQWMSVDLHHSSCMSKISEFFFFLFLVFFWLLCAGFKFSWNIYMLRNIYQVWVNSFISLYLS